MGNFSVNQYYRLNEQINKTEKFEEHSGYISLPVVDTGGFQKLRAEYKIPEKLIKEEELIRITKMEEMEEAFLCVFHVPHLKDFLKNYMKIALLVCQNSIILILQNEAAVKWLEQFSIPVSSKKITLEYFLYELMANFIENDLIYLSEMEKSIICLEETLLDGKMDNFNYKLVRIKKELLYLHNFYELLLDVVIKLEGNPNELLLNERYFTA